MYHERSLSMITGDTDRAKFVGKIEELKTLHNFLQANLTRISKLGEQYVKTGAIEDGMKVADVLLEFALAGKVMNESSYSSNHLKTVGTALKELLGAHTNMLKEYDLMVNGKFKSFIKGTLDPIIADQKELDALTAKLSEMKFKYDVERTVKKKVNHAVRLPDSYEADVKQVKQLTIDTVKGLSVMVETRQYEILGSLSSFMYSLLQYYRFGHGVMGKLVPTITPLTSRLQEQRKEYLRIASEVDVDKLLDTKLERLDMIFQPPYQGYILYDNQQTTKKKAKRRFARLLNGFLCVYPSHKELEDVIERVDLLGGVVESDEEVYSISITKVSEPGFKVLIIPPNGQLQDEWLVALHYHVTLRSYDIDKQESVPPLTQLKSGAKVQDITKDPYNMVRMDADYNRLCADCGKADPEYAVISMGTVVCGECSVILRKLKNMIIPGRVKSLLTDSWDAEELMILKTIGNSRANSLWEANLPSRLKPVPTSDSSTRERFLRAKYELGRFKADYDEVDDLRTLLIQASRENDIFGMYRVLVMGADINQPDKFGRTVIHRLVIEGKVNLVALELLLQAGGDPCIVDNNLRTPLHLCANLDRNAHIHSLLKHGAKLKLKDDKGMTVEDIAKGKGHTSFLDTLEQSVSLMRKHTSFKGAGTSVSEIREKEHNERVEVERLDLMKSSLLSELDGIDEHLEILEGHIYSCSTIRAIAIARRLHAVKNTLGILGSMM